MGLVTTFAGVHYDELIGGTAITPMTANVTITAADTEIIKRGTVLQEADGKYTAAAADSEAVAIVAEDIVPAAAGDLIGTVYTRGLFNAEKLIVADGDTVEAHEAQLRKVGIYLTSIKGLAADAGVAAVADEAKADEAKLSE